ncbi:MAG TPA: tyrosine-protein phosphatase [Rhizomicrobium sp.]|jgi:protein tyrosine/serine phosphatase|nr:tyrosine-protein phosphatase [Rhizomicrobium sp.]
MTQQGSTFETVRNFRDCGGYATRDGRMMRKGRLYRSAQFSDANDDDMEGLKALGITAIVDLRRPMEREKYPSRRWQNFDAHVVEHPGIDGMALPPHLAAFADAGSSGAAAHDAMLQIYRSFPNDRMIGELYRDFFRVLSETDGAVLIHCAAGKDRTGLGVALVQHVVGVQHDDIIENYLQTNDSNLITPITIAGMRANSEREGRPFTDDAIMAVLRVSTDYLDAALDVIEKEHGGIDAYLANTVGVTSEQRDKIVAKLVA